MSPKIPSSPTLPHPVSPLCRASWLTADIYRGGQTNPLFTLDLAISCRASVPIAEVSYTRVDEGGKQKQEQEQEQVHELSLGS